MIRTCAWFRQGVDVLHCPDAGAALCDACRRSGVSRRCEVDFGVSRDRAFGGYTQYFTAISRTGALIRRRQPLTNTA